MSVEFKKKLANKLKNIDKKYLKVEDDRMLVGEGISHEMEEVKEGMGLQGKGKAGMKKMKKGKGYTAGKAKKGKGYTAGNEMQTDSDMEGGFSFKDILRIPATALKAVVPFASVPLKMVGLGKKGGAKVGYNGPAVWKDNLPKPFYYAGGLTAGGMSAGGMSAGGLTAGQVKEMLDTRNPKILVSNENGEYQELEGGNAITNFLSNILQQFNPLHHIGKEISRTFNKGKVMGKRYGGAKGDVIDTNTTGRTGNQALIVGYGKKRGRKPKGAGILGDIAKVANAPMDFLSKFTMEQPTFLESVVGRDNLRNIGRNVSAGVVEKMLGLGKKKEKDANKPKKVNKRAEIVRKVMKEQGLKMIEASKYVKDNNLY